MSVSPEKHVCLTAIEGGVIAAAGAVSLLATYWDDAWHTDRGRDSAFIAPHLALYGSVAVAGVIVILWGLRNLRRSRSLIAVLRFPPLLLAGLGGGFTLLAAPVDAAWHAAYGRDAVLWSPPHMLIVLASTTMTVGVLAGLDSRSAVSPPVAALMLGGLAVSVMEYDTGVPQFNEVFYLPVLLASGLFAVALIRRLVGLPHAVAWALVWYAGARILVMVALWGLGRSMPDPPLAILGLAAADLPWRSERIRLAAGAAGVSALAWGTAAFGLTSLHPGPIGAVALPVLLIFAALLVTGRRAAEAVSAAAAMVTAAAVTMASAPQARAHDPGQGTVIGTLKLTADTTATGLTRLTASAESSGSSCTGLVARRIIARRAGRTRTAPLNTDGACRFSGVISVPPTGRWFLYAELTASGRAAEAWLPVFTDRTGRNSQTRELYRPTAKPGGATAEIASGIAIYAIGLSLLGLALFLTYRTPRPRAAQTT